MTLEEAKERLQKEAAAMAQKISPEFDDICLRERITALDIALDCIRMVAAMKGKPSLEDDDIYLRERITALDIALEHTEGTNKKKTIRFVDSRYRTLFYIDDGQTIVLTFSDGSRKKRTCKYVDEYHTYVGNNCFHICEFAEKMEYSGTSYAPEKTPKLPPECFSTLPSNGELIQIKKGESSYHKCEWGSSVREENEKEADVFNGRMKVTKQLESAMVGGAMFGWDSPAADPANYSFYGQAKKKRPDLSISIEEMKNYGYTWEEMLPLRKEAAKNLFKDDHGPQIFMLYGDDTEGEVIDLCELENHAEYGGLFGVEKDAWEIYLSHK